MKLIQQRNQDDTFLSLDLSRKIFLEMKMIAVPIIVNIIVSNPKISTSAKRGPEPWLCLSIKDIRKKYADIRAIRIKKIPRKSNAEVKIYLTLIMHLAFVCNLKR